MLSALLCLMVPTGIFIFRKDDVTESISRCEYKEAEKDKQADTKNTNRLIKIYLKINLPVVIGAGNRTKVYNKCFAIEQKL